MRKTVVCARNRENLSAPPRKKILVKKGSATNWHNVTFSSRNLIAKLVGQASGRNGRVIRRFSTDGAQSENDTAMCNTLPLPAANEHMISLCQTQARGMSCFLASEIAS